MGPPVRDDQVNRTGDPAARFPLAAGTTCRRYRDPISRTKATSGAHNASSGSPAPGHRETAAEAAARMAALARLIDAAVLTPDPKDLAKLTSAAEYPVRLLTV